MRTKVKTLTQQSRRHIGAARLALSKSDQVLAVAHGVAEPFEWHIRVGGLTGLIQLIIEQQVSTASAAAIWKRFSSGVGRVTAKRIREFDLESLRGMGLLDRRLSMS
jgi:DNA-3-methyladenine glycosylase II